LSPLPESLGELNFCRDHDCLLLLLFEKNTDK